jgi:hypothetical protein
MLLKLIIACLYGLQRPYTKHSPLLTNGRLDRQGLVFASDANDVFARVDSVTVSLEGDAREDRVFIAVMLAAGDTEILFESPRVF